MLLLDKTGTITLVNRQASDFIPLAGVAIEDLADRAQLASLADETAEGRSIVVLAKTLAESLGGHVMKLEATDVAEAILATAQQERVTMIIIGQSERSWWHRMLHGSVTARILSGAHRTDVLVASFDPPQE